MTRSPETRRPAPCANMEDRAEVFSDHLNFSGVEAKQEANFSGNRTANVVAAIAGDALAEAARLITVNGFLVESAARRGDKAEAFTRLRNIAAALEEAREIVRLARRIGQ